MNNPIMYADPSGYSPTVWWEWALALVAVAGYFCQVKRLLDFCEECNEYLNNR